MASLYDTIPPKNRGVVPICKVGRTLGGDGEASRPTGRGWFADEFSQSNTHLGWANPVDRISCWISKTTAIPQTLQEKPREHLAKKDHPPVSRAYPDFSFSVNVTRESSNFSKKKELSALLILKTPLKNTAKSGEAPKMALHRNKKQDVCNFREEKNMFCFQLSDFWLIFKASKSDPKPKVFWSLPSHWCAHALGGKDVAGLHGVLPGEVIQDGIPFEIGVSYVSFHHYSWFIIHHYMIFIMNDSS